MGKPAGGLAGGVTCSAETVEQTQTNYKKKGDEDEIIIVRCQSRIIIIVFYSTQQQKATQKQHVVIAGRPTDALGNGAGLSGSFKRTCCRWSPSQ